MSSAIASKHCYFKASLEKLVQDGWAKVASGLGESLVSVFFFFLDRRRRGNETER